MDGVFLDETGLAARKDLKIQQDPNTKKTEDPTEEDPTDVGAR